MSMKVLLLPWFLLWFVAGTQAADLLPVAGPPADWMGVGIVAGIAAISVAVVGYALFLRRPGLQPGEEALSKLLDLVNKKEEVIAAQAATIAAYTPPTATVATDVQYLLTIPADGSAPTVVRVQL